MDVEEKLTSESKSKKIMKKFLKSLIYLSLISIFLVKIEKAQSIIPYYYFPTKHNLQKKSLSLGKSAYHFYILGNIKRAST